VASSAGASLLSLDLCLKEGFTDWRGQGAHLFDFHKLPSLQHVCLRMPLAWHSRGSVPVGVLRWICHELAEYRETSTALLDFTLRFHLTFPYDDNYDKGEVGFDAHSCQLLDSTLSHARFTSLKKVLIKIETHNILAAGRAELHEWLLGRFPKLAARGILRSEIVKGAIRLDDYGKIRGTPRKYGHFKGNARRRRPALRPAKCRSLRPGFSGGILYTAHGRLSHRYRLDVPHLPKCSDTVGIVY